MIYTRKDMIITTIMVMMDMTNETIPFLSLIVSSPAILEGAEKKWERGWTKNWTKIELSAYHHAIGYFGMGSFLSCNLFL